jgi:hypothetical protein
MANPELQVDQKIREANERMDRIEEALLKITVIWGPGKLEEIKMILAGPETNSETTS